MVILDTNIIIDHLRQLHRIDTLFDNIINTNSDQAAISVITIQELYQGKSMNNLKSKREAEKALSLLEIIPYSHQTAALAGEITRNRNVNIDFQDAAIAATAILNFARLVTFNKKDFSGIPGLELL